ncbi:membrane-associated phospholipid phosphatase [Streptacidiphilus sp. MAP12-16]|uniref:phosphatase PAP2 family protein n=1 Tax=Streptacidiphilus sp. MAP12-16 TaxID=3156300 RepID=UPI003518F377
MEKQRPPVTDPHRRYTAEDTTASSGSHPLSRSTVRRTQTPRATRTGDHHSRPGALPPASGRLPRALSSFWFPIALLALIVLLTEQVLVDGPILGIDRWARTQVVHAVAANPYRLVDTLANGWTDLGSSAVAIPLLGLAAAAAAVRSRSWKPVLGAVLAGAALFATVIPGKILIGRPGPEGQLVGPGDWGWFPSGHTSTAGVCLGTAAWLLATTWLLGSRDLRRALYAVTAMACTGVGLCLIWCDYHWLLDVVAGWCLSGLILWSLVRWSPRSR